MSTVGPQIACTEFPGFAYSSKSEKWPLEGRCTVMEESLVHEDQRRQAMIGTEIDGLAASLLTCGRELAGRRAALGCRLCCTCCLESGLSAGPGKLEVCRRCAGPGASPLRAESCASGPTCLLPCARHRCTAGSTDRTWRYRRSDSSTADVFGKALRRWEALSGERRSPTGRIFRKPSCRTCDVVTPHSSSASGLCECACLQRLLETSCTSGNHE